MKKHLTLMALMSAIALLFAGLAAAPATAATTGPVTLTTQGGFVGPDACQQGPAGYRVVVDRSQFGSLSDWSAEITITGPNGFYDTDFVWDDEGFNMVFFCDSPNVPGTYRVTADVTTESDDYSTSTRHVVSETFVVTGPARSAVTYTKSEFKRHGWAYKVTATRAGKAWAGKKVVLQMRCAGSWHKVLTKTTSARGRVVFTAVPKAGWNSQKICGRIRGAKVWFRFYASGTWNTFADVSPRFHLRRR